MPDGPDWQYAIDIHPEEWRFPGGPTWIAGWLVSRSGRVAVDVRAWIDDRPFLGLCGLPRPEIERARRGAEGPPFPGFSFLLQPHRGARRLRIEVCDQTGSWEPMDARDISVAADAPPRPASRKLGAEIEALMLQLLRARASRPGVPWSQLAADTLSAHRAEPLDTLPNPPFFGALEEPTGIGRTKYGRLTVTGWLAHRERTITRLTAFLDPMQPTPLLCGLARHDVGGLFTDLRNTEQSQFSGQVDLPSSLPTPASLRIFAELDDGRRELVFNRRFRPQVVAGAELPLPPWSRATFLRAATALHRAARRQHLPGGPLAVRLTALRGAWTAYRAAAPVPRPAHPASFEPSAVVVPAALRVVLVTHNLNLEGAPLFALEYARHLAARPGWQVKVVAPQDGPLRPRYESAGLPVTIVDAGALTAARHPDGFAGAVNALARAVDWGQTDVIVANTLLAFWAVHLADRLRKPSLLYIHESAAVRRAFAPSLEPPQVERVERAVGLATRVAFIAAATLRVHARLERGGNFVLVPSWIDLAGAQRYAAEHDRRELRRRHGWGDDDLVIANIGTVCERKGQHVFVRAIELLQRARAADGRAPPALRFVMVGARPDPYLDALRQEVALRGLSGVEFIAETPDPFAYYHAGDLFVCSSFEESFPRVLMEAAAFRLPIVSTNVDGVTEMLGPEDAWLVPAGDAARLAGALREAIAAIQAGDRTRAERAHAAVGARHDSARVLPLHAALAASVAHRA